MLASFIAQLIGRGFKASCLHLFCLNLPQQGVSPADSTAKLSTPGVGGLLKWGLDVAAGWGFAAGWDFARGLEFAAGVENSPGKARRYPCSKKQKVGIRELRIATVFLAKLG